MNVELDESILEYLRYCKQQKRLSGCTIRAYKKDLLSYKEAMENTTIDKYSISAYIESLHKVYKPKSIKRKIASINAYYSYLYFNDYISENPMLKVLKNFRSEKLLPKIINGSDLNNIFKVLKDDISASNTEFSYLCALRNIALIELLLSTGIRVSELSTLKTESVDFNKKQIIVYGKGSKERIIQIDNTQLLFSLTKYDTQFKKKRTYFFVNNRNKRLSEQSIRTIISKLGKAANIKYKVTPHMFRHSFATMLLEEDVDIRYIQRILGHSSILTTQIYTHVSSNKQREILREKNPLFRIET